MSGNGSWLNDGSGRRVVTVTTIGAQEALDVNVAGGVAVVAAQGMQIRNAINVWTDVGWFAGNEEVPVQLYDGINAAVILPNWVQLPGDEATNSLTVSSVEHGYYAPNLVNQRVLPFLNEYDDDNIEIEQYPQLVISEMYGVCDDGFNPQYWQRIHTDCCGSLLVNFGPGALTTLPFLVAGQDETTTSIAVAAGNYGLYAAGGVNTSGYPFLNDLDDDLIEVGQIPQLVISELYGYCAEDPEHWQRVHTDCEGNLSVTIASGTFSTLPFLGIGQDEDTTSIAVASGNYGFWNFGAANASSYRFLVDLDSGLILPEQMPQLVVNENYYYDSKWQGWRRWEGDMGYGFVLSISEHQDDSAFAVELDYITTVGGVYTVDTVDAGDTGAFRMSAMRSQYIRITDDILDLDIALAGGVIGTGITSYGYNFATNTLQPLPLVWELDLPDFGIISYGLQRSTNDVHPLPVVLDGLAGAPDFGLIVSGYDWGNLAYRIIPIQQQAVVSADYILHIPVGGIDYRTALPTAFEIDVDEYGRQSIRHQGTDRYGNMPVSPADTTKSLKVIQGKPEIWSDDYLLWYDDMETKSGDNQTTCKWIAAPNWTPFSVPISFRRYVEGVYYWGSHEYPYLVPPKEGNSMLKLYNEGEEMGELVEADCYTKLGLISNKVVSLEFWFSLIKDETDQRNYTPIAFGFFQFYPDDAYTQYYVTKYLVQLFVPAAGFPPVWSRYDNLGNWPAIGRDVRQMDSVSPPWPTLDLYCWHYAKLTIDANINDPMILRLTIDDTTWEINEPPYTETVGQELGTPMAAICPYFYTQSICLLNTVEYPDVFDQGGLLIDSVKVYVNDSDNDNQSPTCFGQKPDGTPGGIP